MCSLVVLCCVVLVVFVVVAVLFLEPTESIPFAEEQ